MSVFRGSKCTRRHLDPRRWNLAKLQKVLILEFSTNVGDVFWKTRTAHQQRNHGWARSPNYVSRLEGGYRPLFARPPTGRLIAHGTTTGSCNVCLYFILPGASWNSYSSTFEQSTVAEHAKALPAIIDKKIYVSFFFFAPCTLIWLCNKRQQNSHFLN